MSCVVEKHSDKDWLFQSSNPLTTRDIVKEGFHNVIILDALGWAEDADEEERAIDEAVADEVCFAFGLEPKDELQRLHVDENREAFELALVKEWENYPDDSSFCVVICGLKDFCADDPEWHMMTLVVCQKFVAWSCVRSSVMTFRGCVIR